MNPADALLVLASFLIWLGVGIVGVLVLRWRAGRRVRAQVAEFLVEENRRTK